MNKINKNILIGSLIFSIWFSILFLFKKIGLSMMLFIVPILAFTFFILKKAGKIKNEKAMLLTIPIIILSTMYFIHNNQFFNYINIIAIPALIATWILSLIDKNFLTSIRDIGKIFEVGLKPISIMPDSVDTIIESAKENTKMKKINFSMIKRVGKAIVVTIPIVILIIILLSSADQSFLEIFSGMFEKIGKLFVTIGEEGFTSTTMRIFLTVIVFIFLFSFFDYISDDILENKKLLDGEISDSKTLKDNLTIKTILGALNVVYIIFCYLQIKAFANNVNIHYANFAREGFWELMAVSIINLIVILIAKKQENHNKKYIRTMCIMMVVFTFIILISAGLRMQLYENAYGYTMLRLLVYCTLFTEIILFIPTILYIFGKKVNLVKSYFGIILTVYLCMNIANFDNIIAKRNVDRYLETGKIDIYYLTEALGTDATGQIVRVLKEEPKSKANNNDTTFIKEDVKKYLNTLSIELEEENMDFRDFNISKATAKSIIKRNK